MRTFWGWLLAPGLLLAQWTTGGIQGTLRGPDGRSASGVPLVVTGPSGFRLVVRSGPRGRFVLTLPYGEYFVNGVRLFAPPRQTASVDLVLDVAGTIRLARPTPPPTLYPEGFSLPALLLSRDPAFVTEPLDFTGLSDHRPGILSAGAVSWTATRFAWQGVDAGDSYQPGHPLLFPDTQALYAVVAQQGEAGAYLKQPGSSWHGSLSTADTGDALASSNLPPPASRGLVRQSDRFRWMTRDELQVGGPLTRWSDLLAAAGGQWAAQTEPLSPSGATQRSRLLFANARGRVALGERDQLDASYSGSRIDLSDGGLPAGLEAFTGNRLMPSFTLPFGFPGDPETDHFDFVQAGWVHSSPSGSLEVRYGYSTAHLDTSTVPNGQSSIELLGGAVTGAPPLANLAVRPRHQIEGGWQRALSRHRFTFDARWENSSIRNRFSTPSGQDQVTAAGQPAFLIRFDTPVDARQLVRSLSVSAADRFIVTPFFEVDATLRADLSRGSLAEARADLIVWNSLQPRAGFALQPPHTRGLVLRAAWQRFAAPLAGRYLDFGDPAALGGRVYAWDGASPGNLLVRFGGPYSSISPDLRRPFSDQFDVTAEFPFAASALARVHLFRRDDKSRLAALDTGVPPPAFTPVSILDPGPDSLPGTFDDQQLTVYSQNPATLGQDRYLLTNPPGLRMLYAGVATEAGAAWRALSLHASFVAEKSYGPTNPGDSPYENDPGVVGSLFMDPNNGIHAAGRDFADRAYIGKIQAAWRLPAAWSGIEFAGVADYTDGLVFARRVLIEGLPQGPFLVAATARGSPGGGNRAQYVLNSNLRVSRRFLLPYGSVTASADLMNLNNAAQKIQESDLSGPAFNLRLPVAISPARFLRLGFRFDF